MSDFFSGIYAGGGSRGPDVVMNRGPLPPTSSAGMPPGFNGVPDARIDYSSTLLGDLDPYAYGEPGRLSTQSAYLNIPHVAQRIIPQINIPEPQTSSMGGTFMAVNHQVDDGDVAFVVRAMFSPFDLISDKKKYNRQGILFAIDPVMNLSTLNYVLHGLQRYGFDNKDAKNWNALWVAFGIDDYFKRLDGISLSTTMLEVKKEMNAAEKEEYGQLCLEMRHHRKRLAEYIIKNVITPFGIPRGSEKQGGQHQGVVNKSVTNPVDFVTAMVIDGKAINLANFWRQDNVNAGDDLLMYLSDSGYTTYTLSHNPRSFRSVHFEPLQKWEIPPSMVRDDRCSDRVYGAMWKILKMIGDDNITPIGKLIMKLAEICDEADFSDHMNSILNTALKMKRNKKGEPETEETVLEADFSNHMNSILNTVLKMKRNKKGEPEIAETVENELNRAIEESDTTRKKPSYPKVDEPIFQLVPGVSSSSKHQVRDAVWKQGYWHIARSQIMQFKYDFHAEIPNGQVAATSGKPLEVTFSPVWIEPLEADTVSGMMCSPAHTTKKPVERRPVEASNIGEVRQPAGNKKLKPASGTVKKIPFAEAESEKNTFLDLVSEIFTVERADSDTVKKAFELIEELWKQSKPDEKYTEDFKKAFCRCWVVVTNSNTDMTLESKEIQLQNLLLEFNGNRGTLYDVLKSPRNEGIPSSIYWGFFETSSLNVMQPIINFFYSQSNSKNTQDIEKLKKEKTEDFCHILYDQSDKSFLTKDLEFAEKMGKIWNMYKTAIQVVLPVFLAWGSLSNGIYEETKVVASMITSLLESDDVKELENPSIYPIQDDIEKFHQEQVARVFGSSTADAIDILAIGRKALLLKAGIIITEGIVQKISKSKYSRTQDFRITVLRMTLNFLDDSRLDPVSLRENDQSNFMFVYLRAFFGYNIFFQKILLRSLTDWGKTKKETSHLPEECSSLISELRDEVGKQKMWDLIQKLCDVLHNDTQSESRRKKLTDTWSSLFPRNNDSTDNQSNFIANKGMAQIFVKMFEEKDGEDDLSTLSVEKQIDLMKKRTQELENEQPQAFLTYSQLQEAVDLEQPSVDVPEPGTALENTADNTIKKKKKKVPAASSAQGAPVSEKNPFTALGSEVGLDVEMEDLNVDDSSSKQKGNFKRVPARQL